MATHQPPLPVSVHSLHRVATPVTPIHSPHQSLSSTPSRTPVHTLTLHEYRKQQNTPSPQSITPGRRLKRKVAASGLNAIERIPPAPGTPVQHFPPSSQARQQSDRRTGKTALQRSPSFTSLVATSHHQPFGSSSSAPQDPGGTNSDYPSTDEAEGFYRSGEHFKTFKKRTFKPIKHLPRPLPLSARPPVPSPLRSDTSTENLLSSAGLTTGSTLSLSSFPQPPRFEEAVPLTQAGEPASPRANISITATAPATPPETPAVVHYRGASFDLVNPHQSLYLHNIETPADRDADFVDYFQVRPSNELLRGPDTVQQSMAGSDKDSPYLTDKMAPQRALFDDLPSAYQSITGSNRNFQTPPMPNIDLPLPPTPAAFSPKSSTYSTPDQPYIGKFAPAPLKINKPITSPSFMQRLSRAFTRKGHQAKPKPAAVSEELRYMSRGTTPRVSRTYARPLSQNNQSAPVISMEEERGIEKPRAMDPASMSEGDLGYSRYYDVESFYPSSTVGGDERDRSSMYPPSIFNRSSVPHGVRMAGTDYSTEADLHSYTYQFGDSTRSSERTSRGRITQEFLRHPDMPNPDKTDTISKIIDNYGGVDVSETSLLDLMDEEDAEDTIRLSGFETQHSDTSQQFIRPHHSSGLSLFDFGLRGGNSSDGSTVSGPKTPEQPNLFPRMPGLFRGAVGSAPQAPLPLEPPIELEGPRRPFARRDMSSEMFSNSSYGDTRNLLLLSQPFSSFGVPKIQEPLGEPASASSELLPHLSNREATQNDSYSSAESRPNQPSFDRIVNEQIKRLSQISVKSNLSGGIFAVSTPGTPRGEEDHRPASPVSPITPVVLGRPLDPSSSYSQDDGNTAPSEAFGEVERLFSEPGDSQQSPPSIPRMWRKISPARRNEPPERGSPEKDSYTGMNDEEGERDWETVAEQSRANLPRESTEESVADYSSYGGSMNTLGDILVHPGDDRYAHTYKFSHSDTGEPVLLPLYNFQGATGFPNRNALTPPRVASSPYRHPSPLLDHVHPFKSSPPPIGVKSKSSYSAFTLDNVEQMPPMPNIDTVRQAQGSLQARTRLSPRHRQDAYRPAAHPYELSDKETMDLLNSGPNDTILYEEQDQMLHTPPTSRGMRPNDSTDGYIDSMQGQPPTTSSPLTERDNSFSKLTVLGPRGNLTGTPLGTGMHEAGSSLADSSSPGVAWDSTPSKAPENSSPGYFPSSETQYASSPMTQFPASPFTPFATVEHGTPSHTPHGSKASNKSQDRLLLAHRRQRTREALPRSGPQGHSIRSKRASVRGQTKLREMVLTSPDTSTIRTEDTRLSRFISNDRPMSGETTSPLRTYHPVTRLPSENSPHLLHHSPPSSSVYHKRKQRLSWMLFVILVWFPPFLVLYAFGKTDRLISYMSKGEVEECGRTQKRIAMWAGVTGSIIIPVVIIVLLVLAHLSVI